MWASSTSADAKLRDARVTDALVPRCIHSEPDFGRTPSGCDCSQWYWYGKNDGIPVGAFQPVESAEPPPRGGREGVIPPDHHYGSAYDNPPGLYRDRHLHERPAGPLGVLRFKGDAEPTGRLQCPARLRSQPPPTE